MTEPLALNDVDVPMPALTSQEEVARLASAA
jgi:hypothetical protein